MKRLAILAIVPALLVACGGPSEEGAAPAAEAAGAKLDVTPPAPIEVPAPKEVASDEDWEAKTHNKEIEVLQVLNIINPIAAYIVEGFKQYGDRFSPTLQEEWEDTQVQLTKATTLYDSCKERKAAGEIDRQLFLDLEETWQLLVKTGVAGVRTKSMIDAELGKITG